MKLSKEEYAEIRTILSRIKEFSDNELYRNRDLPRDISEIARIIDKYVVTN